VSSHAQPITTKTVAKTNLTVTSSSTFTDATGCPGIGSLYCPYTGSDLYMDATHLCQQRTSGAQNWEAWIKDTRDNEYYRIVYMPDDKWWLAQNVKLASYGGSEVGAAISGCTKDECGRGYTRNETIAAWGGTSGVGENKQGVCPSGWILPTYVQYQNLFKAINSNINFTAFGTASCGGYYFIDATVVTRLKNSSWSCNPGTDYYGWAQLKEPSTCTSTTLESCWYYITAQKNTSTATRVRFAFRDCDAVKSCNQVTQVWIPLTTARGEVRCFSQL
jgi:uncharacterized protein (TIGR02145 family)